MAASPYTIAAVSILLLPIIFSVWLRRIAVTYAANGITAPWVKAAAWMRFATLIVVPGWWSYADCVVRHRHISPVVPLWILLICPTCVSVYAARIISYSLDTLAFYRKWTSRHPSLGTLANTLLGAASIVVRARCRWLSRKKHGCSSLVVRCGSHCSYWLWQNFIGWRESGSAPSSRATFTNVHLC